MGVDNLNFEKQPATSPEYEEYAIQNRDVSVLPRSTEAGREPPD